MSETMQLENDRASHAARRRSATRHRKATYTGDVKLPGMLYARVLRSPHPHARIRHRCSKALALPGREGRSHARELRCVWGSGDSNEQALSVQQSGPLYRRCGSGRSRGGPACGRRRHPVDRCRLRSAALRPRSRRSAEAGRGGIQPGGNLSPNNKGERSRSLRARQHREGPERSRSVFEDRYTRFISTTRSLKSASASPSGKAKSSPCTPPRRAFPIAASRWRTI
jgi:hypothetical protein